MRCRGHWGSLIGELDDELVRPGLLRGKKSHAQIDSLGGGRPCSWIGKWKAVFLDWKDVPDPRGCLREISDIDIRMKDQAFNFEDE